MFFVADNVNALFVEACKAIPVSGFRSCPRGMEIQELLNAGFVLTDPRNNIVDLPERKISPKYLTAEWLWYVSGEQDKEGSDFICSYAPFWDTIRNVDGSLNSNYGYYFFRNMDEVLPTEEEFKPISDYYFQNSQMNYVVDTLVADKDSRQAIVNINNIYHKAKPTKDFPCTVSMQFFIRENRLYMTVCMRSTDLVLGFCNDVFQFTMFQFVVYNELKKYYPELELGSFTLFTGSLHFYERHNRMVEDINQKYQDADPAGTYLDSETLSLLRSFQNHTYSEFLDSWKHIKSGTETNSQLYKNLCQLIK